MKHPPLIHSYSAGTIFTRGGNAAALKHVCMYANTHEQDRQQLWVHVQYVASFGHVWAEHVS